MANNLPTLSFEIYKGSQHLFRKDITAESVTIGRGAAAMLRVDDDALADLHAVINITDDGTVQLLDLGGRGGTRVNGQPVSNTSLRSGDRIQIGDLVLAIAVTDPQAFADEEATQISAPQVGPLPEEVTDAKGLDPITEETGAPVDNTEDVLAFVMRSAAPSNEANVDRSRGKVLEVSQIWGDAVMDVKHYPRSGPPVTLGSAYGWRWRFMGAPVAWVPETFAKFAWLAAPSLSEAGEEWRNEFYVPKEVLPHDNYNLFEWKGNGYVCNFSSSWSGFVDIGEQRFTLQEMISSGKARKVEGDIYQFDMDENTRFIADMSHVIFFAHMVFPGKKALVALTENIDYPFLGIMALMGFVFAIMAGLIITTPPPPTTGTNEVDEKYVELLLEKPEPPPPEPKKDANPDAGEGAKAKKEEGKVGKKDAKMKEAKGNKVEVKKQELDREVAENAGLLGAMSDNNMMESMNNASIDANLTGGIGGVIGARGTQMGSGGLAGRGDGLGGGGSADGLGGMGTKGKGSGSSGYGKGGGSFGQKGEGGLTSIGGDPIILGALDKSLIDAVIKRHMNQIRYCYQRELTKNPSLGGKIVIKFVIAKDGTVSKADVKSSTMGNSAVESCIAGRFMRFQFPEPKGGGIVIVSYPFIFSPG